DDEVARRKRLVAQGEIADGLPQEKGNGGIKAQRFVDQGCPQSRRGDTVPGLGSRARRRFASEKLGRPVLLRPTASQFPKEPTQRRCGRLVSGKEHDGDLI